MNTYQNHNSTRFEELYKQICYRNDIFPLKSILAHLNDEILDICNAEKLDQQNFEAVLQPLSVNRTLRFVAVRSRNICSEPTDKKIKQKLPPIQSTKMLSKICKSISNCLLHNSQLASLELENLLLTKSSLDIIFQGLMENKSINHLSFRHSPIGDDGIEVIGKALRYQSNIKTLDLTDSNISSIGAKTIAHVIEIQSLKNHSMTWKETLRDQYPILDKVSGLVRISLSNNRKVSDAGVKEIVNAVRENLWLKAVDLQDCGLTSIGASWCIEMLKENSTLHVLDVRNNPEIGEDTVEKIQLKLKKNVGGKVSRLKWLKSLNDKSADDPVKCSRQKQCLPWRVEERLKIVRGYPQAHLPGKTRLEELLETDNAEVINTNNKNCLNCQSLQREISIAQQLLNVKKSEVNCLQSELDQVRDERDRLQKLLKEEPIKCDRNHSFMDEETYVCVNNTFQSFQSFLRLLQDNGLYEVLKMDRFENNTQFLDLILHGKPNLGPSIQNDSSVKFVQVSEKKKNIPVTQLKNGSFIEEYTNCSAKIPIKMKGAKNDPPPGKGCTSASVTSYTNDTSYHSDSNTVHSMRSGSSGLQVSDARELSEKVEVLATKICKPDVRNFQASSKNICSSLKNSEIAKKDECEIYKSVVKNLQSSSKSESFSTLRSASEISEIIKDASEISEISENLQSYSSEFTSEEDDSF